MIHNYVSVNIKTLRKNFGLTQAELAEKIGVKRPMIGFYEQGNNTPTLVVLINIAEYFKITLDELVYTIIARVDKPTSDRRKLPLCGVNQAKRTVCPDCGDYGWLYDETENVKYTCPCHY